MNNKYINHLFILFFAIVPWLPAGAQLHPEDAAQVTLPALDTENVPGQVEKTTQEDAVSFAERKLAMERYSERVRELEAQYGVWYTGLQEELIGLGQAWLDLGEYEDAVEVFTRALHISRINKGLYSLDQQDVLQHIIDANTYLTDFEALTGNYAYLVWISNNNYSAGDLRRVPAYQQAAKGHMHVATLTSESMESSKHLAIATNLFRQAVDTISAATSLDDPALINSLYGIVNASQKLVEPYGFITNVRLQLEGHISSMRPAEYISLLARPGLPRFNSRELYNNSVPVRTVSKEDKVMVSLVLKSYHNVRDALTQIIGIHEKNPDLSTKDHVNALVDLGDWYLRFSKRNMAQSFYNRAYQVMANGEFSEDDIHKLFGRPQPLGTVKREPEFESERLRIASMEHVQVPQETAQNQQADPEEKLHTDGKYIVAEFTVSKYGTVKNLKVLESKPEDRYRFSKMARTLIMQTPFRPRLEAVKLVQTEKVRMLYRFE